jgi:DNA-binding CsgD family transcriptional regulator
MGAQGQHQPQLAYSRAVLASVALEGAGLSDHAALITDPHLNVCWSNDAWHRLARIDPALRVEHGRLVGGTVGAEAELSAIVTRVGTSPVDGVVRFLKQRGCYLLRVRPIVDGERWLYLDITADHPSVPVRYFDFATIFALTAAETKTVHRLLSGSTVNDIANECRLAVETVRSHVRAIYSKMGVTSREQFFAKLRFYRILC